MGAVADRFAGQEEKLVRDLLNKYVSVDIKKRNICEKMKE